MALRRPAEAFHPGEFLREELAARGWTRADLAATLGRPRTLVDDIITGRRGVTPATAQGLAAALGMSAEFWTNLDAAYRLWLAARPDRWPIKHTTASAPTSPD